MAERDEAGAADGDHGAERDDHGTDPKPLDEGGVEGADHGPDANRRDHGERRVEAFRERDPGNGRRGQHDRPDGKVDAADEDDHHHGEAEHQHRGRLAHDVDGIARRAEHRRSHGEGDADDHRGDQHRIAGKERRR